VNNTDRLRQMHIFFPLQVVLDKGLGQNGMTLTSLKEEGFQVIFVGIGQSFSRVTFASFVCAFSFILTKLCICHVLADTLC